MVDLCSALESQLITLEEAVAAIRKQITSIKAVETVNLNQALGRILARSPVASIDLPPHRNAAMDGYAIASADIDNTQPFGLELAGTSWAGKPFIRKLLPRQCIRIFTGAIVPNELDTVVM
ncbi:MAG: molybdopterin molybdenumtransferase MoeA, partial [Gammaproteobacteria bacterium]